MKKIVIVDDQPAVRFLFKEIFSDSGQFEVKEAGTALEAKKIFEKFSPDLAVIDVSLPDQDGRTLLSELKAAGLLKQCKVVLMSGVADEDEATLLSDVKADLFLAKPFDINEAKRKIFSLL